MEKENLYYQEYGDRLYEQQGKTFSELDSGAILDSLIAASQTEDYENMTLDAYDDDFRTNTLFQAEIIPGEYPGASDIVMLSANGRSYEIDAFDRNGDPNYREFGNRFRQFQKQFPETNVHLSSSYLMEKELSESMKAEEELDHTEPERVPDQKKEEYPFERDAYHPQEPVQEEKEEVETETLIRNHTRTKINETLPVNLREVANELEDKGYLVHVKPGGHLLVQDKNLSSENSITITRKNAVIEDANLKSPSAINLYNEMKEAVFSVVNENLREQREMETLSAQIRGDMGKIADISLYDAVTDLVNSYAREDTDKPAMDFYDKDGNLFLSISAKDAPEGDVPEIAMEYGERYSDTEATVPLTEEDLEMIKDGTFYKSEAAKDLADLLKPAQQSRTSSYYDYTREEYIGNVEEELKDAFPFLKDNKVSYMAEKLADYHTEKQDLSFSEYGIKTFMEAPFYRNGMMDEKLKGELEATFNDIEKDIKAPSLSDMKDKTYDLDNFSVQFRRGEEITYDSLDKEPATYDREWLTKLARMEDSLMELRYGPVQDAIDVAKSIYRNGSELLSGIAEFEVDGIYSGVLFGKGIESFREGWHLGKLVSEVERVNAGEAHYDSAKDAAIAISNRMDLRNLRDDISRNADIYVRAAVSLRVTCDQMLDHVKEAIELKKQNLLTNERLLSIKASFRNTCQKFVEGYNDLKQALGGFNRDAVAFVRNGADRGRELGANFADYVAVEASSILNNVKNGFNQVSLQAETMLDMKKFTQNRIAEELNDIKVEKAFGRLSYNDFKVASKGRFWEELDTSIKNGEAARRIPEAERTAEDNFAIRNGEQMKFQKEQNLFVAGAIQSEIKNCVKEKVPYQEAVERLAQVYNDSSMTYRTMHSETSMKGYEELTEVDKKMCRDVVTELLNNVPAVEETLMKNEMEKDNVKESLPQFEI